MRLLDKLAHFDISIKHTAGNNLTLKDHLSRHSVKKAMTEKIDDEEYVINFISELFKLNYKDGQHMHMDRNFRSIDKSAIMTSKKNRELTNGNV